MALKPRQITVEQFLSLLQETTDKIVRAINDTMVNDYPAVVNSKKIDSRDAFDFILSVHISSMLTALNKLPLGIIEDRKDELLKALYNSIEGFISMRKSEFQDEVKH